jgi:hypothetical protein
MCWPTGLRVVALLVGADCILRGGKDGALPPALVETGAPAGAISGFLTAAACAVGAVADLPRAAMCRVAPSSLRKNQHSRPFARSV